MGLRMCSSIYLFLLDVKYAQCKVLTGPCRNQSVLRNAVIDNNTQSSFHCMMARSLEQGAAARCDQNNMKETDRQRQHSRC